MQEAQAAKIMEVTNELLAIVREKDLTLAEAGLVVESLRRTHQSWINNSMIDTKVS